MSAPKLDDYVPVAERIELLREKYPDASLQPANPLRPFELIEAGGKEWIVYAAACYRTPDDQRPGIGVAWEQVPGRTNFTRDSELQNAETSAWGRAIVAALAADTKRSVASREDVEARTAPEAPPDPRETLRAHLGSFVERLADTSAWDAWKADHKGWHRTEKGLTEAMRHVEFLLAEEGSEPFEIEGPGIPPTPDPQLPGVDQ